MQGPEWLMTSELTSDLESETPTEYLQEMKTSKSDIAHGLLSVVQESLGVGEVMKGDEFSSYRRLISVTGLLLQFCHLIHQRTKPNTSSLDNDRAKAEVLWIIEA